MKKLRHELINGIFTTSEDWSQKTNLDLETTLDALAVWMEGCGIESMKGGEIYLQDGKVVVIGVSWLLNPDNQTSPIMLSKEELNAKE